MKNANNGAVRRPESLSVRVETDLRQAISSGEFAPGDKLPSEAQLIRSHGVSRTVVREALAALRLDGLVEPRQGAGVFVLDPRLSPDSGRQVERARLASILEILEVRTPVEVAAAGLAALRRSPAQEEHILDCHAALMRCIERGALFGHADFALHLAIAEATNNRQFTEFLEKYGDAAVPKSQIVTGDIPDSERQYHEQLVMEHQAIVLAISRCDGPAAEQAMRDHLIGSQTRHRELLQSDRLA
ncbi:FadR family transcriptional regulator [Rhodobacteraceae bacterium]|nr:FadR family transcriptional regulator [Paracoccaceae bacterium]